jgi:hypothetical protein
LAVERGGGSRGQPGARRVERRAARHDGHGVDARGQAAVEHLADAGAQNRGQGRPAHQHHALDLGGGAVVLAEHAAHQGHGAAEQGGEQGLELGAADGQLQVDGRAGAVHGQLGHGD